MVQAPPAVFVGQPHHSLVSSAYVVEVSKPVEDWLWHYRSHQIAHFTPPTKKEGGYAAARFKIKILVWMLAWPVEACQA